MDDDIKTRFDDVDKRIASTEKRIDDVKWFVGGYTGLFTIVFGIVAVLGNLNFNSEKLALREFERDLRTELGKADSSPLLELLAADKEPLQGKEIVAEFSKDGSNLNLNITHFIRNVGEGLSGPMNVKVYASKPLRLESPSTDESRFEYEAVIDSTRMSPSQIPGGRFSMTQSYSLPLVGADRPSVGRYPGLLKIYYGKGKVAQADFFMVVKKE